MEVETPLELSRKVVFRSTNCFPAGKSKNQHLGSILTFQDPVDDNGSVAGRSISKHSVLVDRQLLPGFLSDRQLYKTQHGVFLVGSVEYHLWGKKMDVTAIERKFFCKIRLVVLT